MTEVGNRALYTAEEMELLVHDLVGPLATIRSQAQLLRRRANEGRAERELMIRSLEVIERQAGNLAEQINVFLEGAALHTGGMRLRREPTSLLICVEDAITSLTPDDRARVKLEVAEEPHRAEWDPLLIARVIRNLIANGLKYSPRDQPVEVVVNPERDGNIELTVHDHGVGLDEDELERLFGRFYRAPRVERTAAGTGLGLYGSRLIAEAHGGRIWAESPGGGLGSTFYFLLPVDGRTGR